MLPILCTSIAVTYPAHTYISHKDLTASFGAGASVRHASTHVAPASVATKATVHVHARHAHPVKTGAHPVHRHAAHSTTCNQHRHTHTIKQLKLMY